MIYFIRDPQADRVKIGRSKDPWNRFRNIQTGHPGQLILEAVIAGDSAEEKALHARFGRRHAQGEWFVWRGEVAQYVAGLETILKPVPQPSRRSPVTSEVTQAIVDMGFVRSYASHFLCGHRPWPFDLAVAVWRRTGHKVGPLKNAPDDDLAVLAKYLDGFAKSKPTRVRSVA